ncbi:MAG: hypothetical protein GY870_22065 [archaeon]|nr:hypothetical protein [archaeon]
MDWKKSILSIVAVFGFIGVMSGIFSFNNTQTEKIIRNEMSAHFNEKRITAFSDDLKEVIKVIPQFKILMSEVPEMKKQIKRTNEILAKAEFIVLRNQEDCPEGDEDCIRAGERYVKRR